MTTPSLQTAREWPAAVPVVAGGRHFLLYRSPADPRSDAAAAEPPPVLVLHGISADDVQWRPIAQQLPADREILVPDLPGFGGSAGLGELTTAALAAAFAALVIAEVDRPVDVIGIGWGGTLAIALSAARPDLVRRLAVISGGWPPALATGHDHPAPGLTRWQSRIMQSSSTPLRKLQKAYLAPEADFTGSPRPEQSLVIWGAAARRYRPRAGEKEVSALGRYVDPATVAMITLAGIGDAPQVAAPGTVGSLLCEFLRAS